MRPWLQCPGAARHLHRNHVVAGAPVAVMGLLPPLKSATIMAFARGMRPSSAGRGAPQQRQRDASCSTSVTHHPATRLHAYVCGPGEFAVDPSLHQQQIRQSVPSRAHALEPPPPQPRGAGRRAVAGGPGRKARSLGRDTETGLKFWNGDSGHPNAGRSTSTGLR